jgi:hypothetical protein
MERAMTTPPRLVVVRTFGDQVAARLAQSALDASGIESLIRSDDGGGLQPGLAFSNGVEVVVSAEDLERADEILRQS